MNYQSVNRGKQLKLVREYRGYTQSELVSHVNGISQGNLSRFEKGFEGVMSDDNLKSIMSFLDWPFKWLDVPHSEPIIERRCKVSYKV